MKTFLAAQHAKPTDPTSPRLYVSSGFLTDEAERYLTSEAYAGLPYCYLLNIGDAVTQLYDGGSARYLNPVDVVFEARTESSKPFVDQLWNGVFNSVWQVDELSPGVRLASPFKVVGGYRAEARRKGFLEAMLRLESSW